MGQQGSRPDANAVTELPQSPGAGRRLDLELQELTDGELSSQKRRERSERTDRPPSSGKLPTTPKPPIARPPSSQGSRSRGQQLVFNKSGQLRRTAERADSPKGLPVAIDEDPATRPGTAASLVSVNAAYRRDPHRYRVELPGQMPDIHQGDPSPPASQPASLTLRVRPGTSQNQMRLGGTPPLPTAKAMRPSSSGGDPALQPLPFSVTLKGAGHRRQSPGNLGDSSVGRRYSDRDEQGRRGIRWVEDVARHYRIAGSVMPSCHAGMEIRHASRATVDQDASSETFVVKLRYKNKSFQGKNEESRWRNNTELILNMPQTNGIARLIDVLEDTKAYYVIMERAGGCDLYECLSGAPERRLPASEAREVLKELLAAVAELHSHGFIHKDLKLENVMLNRPGPKCPSHIRRNLATSPGAGVKLIDFDTVEEWNSTGPKSRHVLGTDQYIAPEAYEGKYSPASDIFAVGVIAFKMLTGSFPYNGRLFDDKPGENWVGSPKMKEIKQKLCDARVSFSHPVFEKDPGAQRLVSRMLAVEEKDRPDAQECLQDPWLSEPARSSKDTRENRENRETRETAPIARAVLVHQVRGRAQPVQSQQRSMAHNAAIGNVQQLLAGRTAESSQGRRKRHDDMPGNWVNA